MLGAEMQVVLSVIASKLKDIRISYYEENFWNVLRLQFILHHL